MAFVTHFEPFKKEKCPAGMISSGKDLYTIRQIRVQKPTEQKIQVCTVIV